uniref:C2H2-type domain-containing protein n=1 Tax=Parastrongyloides trichosuri TaxID=131310 RepID=A0A0N5A3F2_PARTI
MSYDNRSFLCGHCKKMIKIDDIVDHVNNLINPIRFACSSCGFETNRSMIADDHCITYGHILQERFKRTLIQVKTDYQLSTEFVDKYIELQSHYCFDIKDCSDGELTDVDLSNNDSTEQSTYCKSSK